jgi:hypothetical protein
MSLFLQSVSVIDQNLIKLQFSAELSTNNDYYNVNNYLLLNLTDSTTPFINLILPQIDAASDVAYLFIKGLVIGDQYKITTVASTLSSPSGTLCSVSSAVWTHVRTKVDSALSHIASMYNTEQGSIFRSILQAIMLSDETIGGSFENLVSPSVAATGGLNNWGARNWGGSNWGGG